MNKIIGLTNVERNRIAELFAFYLEPSERFSVNGKGEVSMKVKSWFARLFREEESNRLDFTEVVRLLTDKIMDGKGEIPYISQLCGASIGELVVTNDRPNIIKALYIAHLTDVQPGMAPKQKPIQIGKEVTIERRERKIPVNYNGGGIFRRHYQEDRQLARDVTAILNGADAVYIVEENN